MTKVVALRPSTFNQITLNKNRKFFFKRKTDSGYVKFDVSNHIPGDRLKKFNDGRLIQKGGDVCMPNWVEDFILIAPKTQQQKIIMLTFLQDAFRDREYRVETSIMKLRLKIGTDTRTVRDQMTSLEKQGLIKLVWKGGQGDRRDRIYELPVVKAYMQEEEEKYVSDQEEKTENTPKMTQGEVGPTQGVCPGLYKNLTKKNSRIGNEQKEKEKIASTEIACDGLQDLEHEIKKGNDFKNMALKLIAKGNTPKKLDDLIKFLALQGLPSFFESGTIVLCKNPLAYLIKEANSKTTIERFDVGQSDDEKRIKQYHQESQRRTESLAITGVSVNAVSDFFKNIQL